MSVYEFVVCVQYLFLQGNRLFKAFKGTERENTVERRKSIYMPFLRTFLSQFRISTGNLMNANAIKDLPLRVVYKNYFEILKYLPFEIIFKFTIRANSYLLELSYDYSVVILLRKLLARYLHCSAN